MNEYITPTNMLQYLKVFIPERVLSEMKDDAEELIWSSVLLVQYGFSMLEERDQNSC